jgi:Flp pilus assembly protein TadD
MGNLATAYLAVGKNEQALALLEHAYDEQPRVLTNLRVNPAYDLLRSDSRFQQLLLHIGPAK